jgi:hypothetical protein
MKGTLSGAPAAACALALALAADDARAAEPAGDLAAAFARATEDEQTAGAAAALDSALALLDRAVAGGDPRQREAAVLAALDLLGSRDVPALELVGSATSLAFRHPGAFARVWAQLDRAYQRAAELSPFARATIAQAAHDLALHSGDAAAVESWRERTGCVREATVIGPLDWPPLVAVTRPTPFERPGARLLATYPGVAPFGGRKIPTAVTAVGCGLDLLAQSALDGLRALVVDLKVARPQRLALELESRAAATLVVGGQTVLTRGYQLGGGRVRLRGFAQVPAGRVRVVVRVGLNGDGAQVALQVLGEDGTPIPTVVPRPDDAAAASASSAGPLPLVTDPPRDEAERSLLAAGLLAMGDARSAERLLEQATATSDGKAVAPAEALPALLYTRALQQAADLPDNRSLPLLRAALAATLRRWPTAWEALAAQALLQVKTSGAVEGQIQALGALATARARLRDADPALLALEAALAARADIRDRATAGLAELARRVPGTALLAQVDRAVTPRVGQDQEAFLCAAPGLNRAGSDCLTARIGRGDRRGTLAEIERLRRLWGPTPYQRGELLQRYALGESAAAAALYDRALPAYRPLGLLYALFASDPAGLRARLERDLTSTSDDPPTALAALTALLDTSPAPAWEAESARRVAQDRQAAATEGAATLVLVHREAYEVKTSGLLRYTVYSLRRVSGSADVRSIGEVGPQAISGRQLHRSLRRRIFKPDGRILDPEPQVGGEQRRTDLSQLEPGDYLEEIGQGFSVPLAMGDLSIQTQDLLPARTSVQEATVEIRRPQALAVGLWAHPQLGRPTITRQGADTVTTYSLRGAAPRRLETRVPWPDRQVSIYLATARWQDSGALLADTMAALRDEDPLVTAWARGLVPSNAPGGNALAAVLESVVAGVGKAIKRADRSVLSDPSWAPARAQQRSARTMLEMGDGSRTWLAYRALRELGLEADIVVAEEEPFSADPQYPHRFGRFRHPLVVVKDGKDFIWLDLDVRGPPLPPGRVSAQLRGRWAVDRRGVLQQPDWSRAAQPTEVDIDLRLDEKGTARGTVTVTLRGQEAQYMADELPYRVGLQRDQRLRAVVLGWLPSATVNEVALASEEEAWQVSVKAGVELPGYGQWDGAAWTLPGLEPLHNLYDDTPVSTLGATFAKHRGRDSALSIDEAIQYRLRRRVQLPAPARLTGAQPVLALRAPDVEARRTIALSAEGPALDERFELSIPTAALDRRRYEQFVKATARIDEVFQTPTRLVSVTARP